MESPLATAFLRNHEVGLYVLESIPDADLEHRYDKRTRTVRAQFAHLHNVRVYHLQRRGKAFLGGLTAFGRGAEPGRGDIVAALAASATAMAAFLAAVEEKGKVSSWHGPPASFLGYLTAHEAHHRALVILTLRLAGAKLSKDVVYGMWNWSKKGSFDAGHP
ncbi:MAG: hypothetical protein GY838_04330 [bacterium]|nr:hypothetical protein [bacterium]